MTEVVGLEYRMACKCVFHRHTVRFLWPTFAQLLSSADPSLKVSLPLWPVK